MGITSCSTKKKGGLRQPTPHLEREGDVVEAVVLREAAHYVRQGARGKARPGCLGRPPAGGFSPDGQHHHRGGNDHGQEPVAEHEEDIRGERLSGKVVGLAVALHLHLTGEEESRRVGRGSEEIDFPGSFTTNWE